MHPRKQQFIELFEQSGWKQAEAARRLELSRGGMNGIIKGKTVPSEGLLKLFQMTLFSDGVISRFSDESSAQAWANDLVNELQSLPSKQRDHLVKAFRHIVQMFPVRQISYSKNPVADLVHEAIDLAQGGGNAAGAKAPSAEIRAGLNRLGKDNLPGKTKP